MTIQLHVNGQNVTCERPAMAPLVTFLRDDLGLTGTKLGCGEGRCGACTVLMSGVPVASCLYPVAQAVGESIQTVESLAGSDGELTDVQDALVAHGGVQCGACIPGMVMTLTALQAAGQEPIDDTVRYALAGNICRCTGYQKIIDAAVTVLTKREDQ